MVERPDELRADLQHYYGIDLDHAMAGEHTCGHVASLVMALPADCAINRAAFEDMGWGRTDVLLATIANELLDLVWGLGGGGGRKPRHIGPSWMSGDGARREKTRTMTIAELDAQIRKFEALGDDEVREV